MEHDSSTAFLGWCTAIGGLLIILAAFGVLCFDSVLWLRDGEWPADTIRDWWLRAEFAEPHLQWLGAQKIAEHALDLPTSLGLFAVGCLAIWIGSAYGKAAEERARRAERFRGWPPSPN